MYKSDDTLPRDPSHSIHTLGYTILQMPRSLRQRRPGFVPGRTYYVQVSPHVTLLIRGLPAAFAVATNHSCGYRRQDDAVSRQAGADRPHGKDPRLPTHRKAMYIDGDRSRRGGVIRPVLRPSLASFRWICEICSRRFPPSPQMPSSGNQRRAFRTSGRCYLLQNVFFPREDEIRDKPG